MTQGASLRTITLTFPMPPNLANARMHWAAKYKRQNAWALKALALERKLHGVHEPITRARITAVWHTYNRMDDDNAIARLKWCLDLLVRRQIIVDDKRPHCQLAGIPEQYIDRKNPRVEVTIEEVALEAAPEVP